jgi:hypothetical protein
MTVYVNVPDVTSKANVSKAAHPLTIGKARLNERGRQKRALAVSYSQRTLSAVGTLIGCRHEGPCNTDDAAVYVDVVLALAIQVQNEKGKAPAAMEYRKAFNSWPDGLEKQPEMPSPELHSWIISRRIKADVLPLAGSSSHSIMDRRPSPSGSRPSVYKAEDAF